MSEPENLILEHLKALREAVRELDVKTDVKFKEVEARFEEHNEKLAAIATTLNSVKVSQAGLVRELQIIAMTVDNHTKRLDKIEEFMISFTTH